MKKMLITMISYNRAMALFLGVLILSFSSCRRQKGNVTPTPTKTYDIKGYYQGTYGFGNSTSGNFLSLVIEENGKAIFINNKKFNGTSIDEIIYGTYELTGNQISITTSRTSPQLTVDLEGTFDNTTGKLSGSLNSTAPFSGKFVATKDISSKESISGYWKGSYKINGVSETPYFMIVENDGTCVVSANHADGFTGSGINKTYYGFFQLTGGTIFTNTITSSFGTGSQQYSNKADFDNSNGTLKNGTYGPGSNYTSPNNWTWSMTKMYY